MAQPNTLADYDEQKCYGQAFTPIYYKSIQENIQLRAAYKEKKQVALQYDTVVSKVLVKNDAIDFESYKADYNIIKEKILIREEGKIYRKVFNMVENPRIKRSSFIGWNVKSNCAMPKCDDVILQWLVLGTLFDTLEVPELASMKIETQIPPIYKTIYRIQPKEHALIETQKLPGQYELITQYIVRQHAQEETFKYPTKFRTIERKLPQPNSNAKIWVEVLCPDDLNGHFIGQLQLALKKEKHPVGKVNGVWNKLCQTALENYQRQNSLPIGQFDKATIQALGLNYDVLTSTEGKKAIKRYNDIFEEDK